MGTCWSISIYFYLTCGSINTYLRISRIGLSDSYQTYIKTCTCPKLIVREYIDIVSTIIYKSGCCRTFYLMSCKVIGYCIYGITLYFYSNGSCLTSLRCCIITYLVGYVIITWFHSCRYFHLTCSGIKLWYRISCYLWRSWIDYCNRNLVWSCSYSWFCTIKFCTIEYISDLLRSSTIGRRCYRIRNHIIRG